MQDLIVLFILLAIVLVIFGLLLTSLVWLCRKICPADEWHNPKLTVGDIYDNIERGCTTTDTILRFNERDLLAFEGYAEEAGMTHGTKFHLPYIREHGSPRFQAMILSKVINGLGCHVYRQVSQGDIDLYTTYPWKSYQSLKHEQ